MPSENDTEKGGWLASLDLPPWLKSRALKAFDGLLGGVGEKLSAQFERSREFDDAVNKAAIAKAVSEDSPFVEHALTQHAARVTRFQRNRHKIAEKAVEYIKQNKTKSVEEGQVDQDWTDVFGSYSERVSDEMMQDLWAKVLSGEIGEPGSFSRSTLRTISEMSVSDANFVASVRSKVFQNSIIDDATDKHGFFKGDYIRLEALGIVLDARTAAAKKFSIDDKEAPATITLPSHVLKITPAPSARKRIQKYDDKTFLNIPALLLTKQGEELMSLLPEPNAYDIAKHIKNVLGEDVREVEIFDIIDMAGGGKGYDNKKGTVI